MTIEIVSKIWGSLQESSEKPPKLESQYGSSALIIRAIRVSGGRRECIASLCFEMPSLRARVSIEQSLKGADEGVRIGTKFQEIAGALTADLVKSADSIYTLRDRIDEWTNQYQ